MPPALEGAAGQAGLPRTFRAGFSPARVEEAVMVPWEVREELFPAPVRWHSRRAFLNSISRVQEAMEGAAEG